MKSNELRIGNWIYDNEVGFKDTFQACSASIVNNEKFGTDYSAITLTEEWLLKFGFEKFEDTKEYYKRNLFIFMDERYDMNNAYLLDECGRYTLDVLINHVHQLQNLYFALTGEELNVTIK